MPTIEAEVMVESDFANKSKFAKFEKLKTREYALYSIALRRHISCHMYMSVYVELCNEHTQDTMYTKHGWLTCILRQQVILHSLRPGGCWYKHHAYVN